MAVLLMRLVWMMTVMMIIMTIRKIFGHLMNGSFGKEKIKEIMKVKKIESENQSAIKVKVEKEQRRGSKKWFTNHNMIRHHVNEG